MWISADSPRREYVFPRRTSVARRQKAAFYFVRRLETATFLLLTNSPLKKGREF
jgi:hypothetical protein